MSRDSLLFVITQGKIHDTHIHLDILLQKINEFNNTLNSKQISTDLDNLLANHKWVLQPTVSTNNFIQVESVFKQNSKIYFLAGSHPEIVDSGFDVKNYISDQQQKLKPFLESPIKQKLLGIGECGLDYFYTQDKEIIKKQKELFEAQIQLAIDSNLPLIIHCREAFDDIYDILKKFKQIHSKFWIHCFTGNTDQLRKILDIGGKVAFGGILTFGKNADYLRDSANFCPDDSWLLETDSPFLAPAPYRGQICQPVFIDLVAQKMSEIKNISKQEIWQIAEKNVRSLISLDFL